MEKDSVHKAMKYLHITIEQRAQKWPDVTALQMFDEEYGRISYTYRDMIKRSKGCALQLRNRGLCGGERVVLLSENHHGVPVAFLGILYAGCTAVVVDSSLPAIQINKLIKQADCRAVISADKVSSLIDDDYWKSIPVLDYNNDFKTLNDRRGPFPGEVSSSRDNNPEIAAILFTSGTTGVYKGVMLHHEGFLHAIETALKVFNGRPGDNIAAILPFYQVYGRESNPRYGKLH